VAGLLHASAVVDGNHVQQGVGAGLQAAQEVPARDSRWLGCGSGRSSKGFR
jgi:hypothetical protein